MHIGIDGNEANVEERVGIGEYAYQLIKHLSCFQNKHSFTIFLKSPPKVDFPKSSSNWNYLVFGPRFFWTWFALPFKLYFSLRPDLFFSPTHYGPRFSPIPTVVSIMDLSYIYYPQLFKKKDLLQLINWTAYSVKRAKKIITISHFSKKTIVEYYKIDPDDVYVAYPGYNREVYHQNYSKEEVEEIKRRYSLSTYIIFVGTIQPRKNIIRLIRAFSSINISFPDLKLVLVGKRGWLYEDILKMISQPGLKDKVIYLGYLEDKMIAKLYNGALAFVLPSLYEGFGLTVVEAMACGLPVVVSNSSSLPEVVGDAGVLVDGQSTLSISEGILKVISTDQKYFRKKLVERGLKRVQSFSWENCALNTINFLETPSNIK